MGQLLQVHEIKPGLAEPGILASNPSPQETETGGCKFEASLHYVVPCWHELQCETLPGEGGMVQLRQVGDN